MFQNLKANWQFQAALKDLRGNDTAAAMAALEVLKGFASEERGFSAIVEASGHLNPEIRIAAVQLLLAIGGDKCVEPLIIRLKDTDEKVRSVAGRGMGELSNLKNVQPLTKGLESKDAYIRGVCARTLGKVAVKETIPNLIIALTDNEKEVRKIVAKALRRLGEARWQQIVNGDDLDFQRMGASGDKRLIQPLLKSLTSPFPAIRNSVMNGLIQMKKPEEVVPALVAMLSGGNVMVRKIAIEALGNLKDKRAMEALIYCLDDTDPVISAAAVAALDKLDQGAV
jgi:HEAT repeat-containing taxis protein